MDFYWNKPHSPVRPPMTFFQLTGQVNRFWGRVISAVKKPPLFSFSSSVSINFFFLHWPPADLSISSPPPKLLHCTGPPPPALSPLLYSYSAAVRPVTFHPVHPSERLQLTLKQTGSEGNHSSRYYHMNDSLPDAQWTTDISSLKLSFVELCY